ncbi:hypothetical protein TA3x_004071 [Tundrisphaera sp. TA3]|uniref:hypothetical protein n=1 Tax=Tundrisphaera sp. TA3 TaxID=3435775 RepID=UPI003EBA0774
MGDAHRDRGIASKSMDSIVFLVDATSRADASGAVVGDAADEGPEGMIHKT